jgi:hypothetical protein
VNIIKLTIPKQANKYQHDNSKTSNQEKGNGHVRRILLGTRKQSHKKKTITKHEKKKSELNRKTIEPTSCQTTIPDIQLKQEIRQFPTYNPNKIC